MRRTIGLMRKAVLAGILAAALPATARLCAQLDSVAAAAGTAAVVSAAVVLALGVLLRPSLVRQVLEGFQLPWEREMRVRT